MKRLITTALVALAACATEPLPGPDTGAADTDAEIPDGTDAGTDAAIPDGTDAAPGAPDAAIPDGTDAAPGAPDATIPPPDAMIPPPDATIPSADARPDPPPWIYECHPLDASTCWSDTQCEWVAPVFRCSALSDQPRAEGESCHPSWGRCSPGLLCSGSRCRAYCDLWNYEGEQAPECADGRTCQEPSDFSVPEIGLCL